MFCSWNSYTFKASPVRENDISRTASGATGTILECRTFLECTRFKNQIPLHRLKYVYIELKISYDDSYSNVNSN